MPDFRTDDDRPAPAYGEHRKGMGGALGLIILLVVVVIGILFATGFFSANVTNEGELPEVSVDAGSLPGVDVDSKEVVVGTKETTVEVPTIDTQKETIDVPVIGVKEGAQD